MTIKDAYPIPRMDECIDSLGDARVFSTLDCNANYWQIPVAEEDKHLTAFTCLSGAWQCVGLPFGLCNALATFQRAIDMILAGVKWQICLVSSAVLPMPLFGYLEAIRGRHSVLPRRNRAL